MTKLETILIDDGTLDTVIKVIGPNGSKIFRFNFDYESEPGQTREEFIEHAKELAQEAYFD